ncbi:MAG: right-handed parallel beta-helix repeat-containing protein [Candidatus Krumholzibacteria bacterium]|jgi:hypothetical protein|nr:right-handed parallel beta-helix repeat-containing protein [Candidatus Krumholzibacteria bacterium]
MRWLLIIPVIPIVFVNLTAIAANGHTWTVAQDFSGDFWNIQNAVDIASDGDVIEIGPGWYTEFQTVSGWEPYDVYVNLGEKSLTLIGSGAALTVIGPLGPDQHHRYTYGIYAAWAERVVLENLAVRNIDYGGSRAILQHGGHLTMNDCVFADCYEGVNANCDDGVVIDRCQFSNIRWDGLNLYLGSSPGSIGFCTFENVRTGVYLGSGQGVVFHDCTLRGGTTGIGFNYSSIGTIARCSFKEINDKAIIHGGSSTLALWDNEISVDDAVGVYLAGLRLYGSGNVIISGSWCLWGRSVNTKDFRDNQFLAGGPGAYAVRTADYTGNPLRLDLRYNWWGTDDADVIDALIYDGNDSAATNIIVDYVPFLGQPVATEATTWSQIKQIFRE